MRPITDNTLFYGDNLPILREYIPTESVDLIYLDPPFKGQNQRSCSERRSKHNRRVYDVKPLVSAFLIETQISDWV